MAIDALSSSRLIRLTGLIALAFALLALRSNADDQIIKNDGTIVTGQITGVSGDGSDREVDIISQAPNGGTAKNIVYLTDIKSVVMAAPDAVTKVQAADTAPADVITALEPEVKQFAGLPADWVVNSMAQLADAYGTTGKPDRASALYTQIHQLYPGSPYENEATAGQAKLLLQQGKLDDAMNLVKPVIAAANQKLAPSTAEGGADASAFLVYGRILEAQKQPSQALEAYLTVKTIFYQNPAFVEQAGQLAKALRDQNPGLSVD
jgi:tetratricopeptide (TPR) repeat protein